MQTTPLQVRAIGVPIDAPTRRWMEQRTTRQLGKFAPHIERISLRFEDVNGPRRGSKGIVCRAKVVLSRRPSVVIENSANAPRAAFALVAPAMGQAVKRSLGRAPGEVTREARADVQARKVSKPARKTPVRSRTPGLIAATAAGSLIGRRVGQGRKNLLRAAERPEKKRRDALVDTSMPGVNASARKVGLRGTASRNTKLNRRGMTAALEDSATGKPSRKSTRRSQNRAKSGSQIGRATKRKLSSPKSRASRAHAAR
jgi:hypothetical protein